jgi:hypothetical protein
MTHDGHPPTDEPTPDGDENPVRHRWDGQGRPSVAVVEAVAATIGRDPTEMTPLQRTVDVDALDSLLDGGDGSPVSVSFEYQGLPVTVDGDGGVTVWPDGHESV